MSKQEQPRRLADADVEVFGAESSSSRSAPIALVVSSALCGHAPSRQAHVDVASPAHAGLAVFTLGSAVCGAAPSLGTLIAARCFQGLGAAAILCVNVAMITRSFPAAERGRALGLNMILLALGVSMGPTIGGILTQALSW